VAAPVTCSTQEDHQRRAACLTTMLGVLGKRLTHLVRRNAAGRQVHPNANLHEKHHLHADRTRQREKNTRRVRHHGQAQLRCTLVDCAGATGGSRAGWRHKKGAVSRLVCI